MLLTRINDENGWMFADYQATWHYGYEFMLDAAQTIIDLDFQDQLQRVAVSELAGAGQLDCLEEVRLAENKLRKSPKVAEETGVLIVSGMSRMMDCPIQLMFYNQTNLIRLCTPSKDVFEIGGDNAFTNYLSSIEIKAYCAIAERKARQM